MLPALWLVRKAEPRVGWRLAVALVGGAAVNAAMVGGDTFALFRIFLPAIPIGSVALVQATTVLADRLRRRTHGGVVGRAVAPAVVAAVGATIFSGQFLPSKSLLTSGGPSLYRLISNVNHINSHYFIVGRWLRDNVPHDTVIATNAAGIVPYMARLPTIDMLGLNDTHIAHAGQVTAGVHGHERHDARYVLELRPHIILPGLPVLTLQQPALSDIRPWFGQWLPYLPGDRELFEQTDFWHAYEPVSVQVRPGVWFTFFSRRDLLERRYPTWSLRDSPES